MKLLPSSALCVLEFEGMLKSAQQTLLIHEKQYWSRLIVTWIQGSILMLGWALLALWVLICCLLFRLEKCFFFSLHLVWCGLYHHFTNTLWSWINSKMASVRLFGLCPVSTCSFFLKWMGGEVTCQLWCWGNYKLDWDGHTSWDAPSQNLSAMFKNNQLDGIQTSELTVTVLSYNVSLPIKP